MRIAIVAALPGELLPLVKGWGTVQKLPAGVRMWQRPDGPQEVVAACAGMGAGAARRAFAAAEFGGALDLVLSVGWAGGLVPLDKEQAHRVSEVIDGQTGERFGLDDAAPTMRLVTMAEVADAAEKRRLAASYGAALVDMEAAAIARLAQIRGIRMVCLKAVSDDAEARLPDLNRFIDASGAMRMGAFLAYVAVRPVFWGSLIGLGQRSARAAEVLAAAIEHFLVEQVSSTEGVRL